MATYSSQIRPSTTVDSFLARYPEVQLGRASLEKLQSEHSGGDTFSIVNKPFENMVLYQEFDADTKRRIYVVALVDNQEALEYYAEVSDDAAEEGSKCDRAGHHGPDHLIYDYMYEEDKADCLDHKEAAEPDPDCPACWPVLYGAKCSP